MVIDPDLTEALENACDTGRDAMELQALYPQFYFGDLQEGWWKRDQDVAARSVSFLRRLAATQFRRVVVVGHRGFFRQTLSLDLENCSVVRTKMEHFCGESSPSLQILDVLRPTQCS